MKLSLAFTLIVAQICTGSKTDYTAGAGIYPTYPYSDDFTYAIDKKPDAGMETYHESFNIAGSASWFLRLDFGKEVTIENVWILKGNVGTKIEIYIGNYMFSTDRNYQCAYLVQPDGVIECQGTG